MQWNERLEKVVRQKTLIVLLPELRYNLYALEIQTLTDGRSAVTKYVRTGMFTQMYNHVCGWIESGSNVLSGCSTMIYFLVYSVLLNLKPSKPDEIFSYYVSTGHLQPRYATFISSNYSVYGVNNIRR